MLPNGFWILQREQRGRLSLFLNFVGNQRWFAFISRLLYRILQFLSDAG